MVRLDFQGQNRPLALNADRGDGKMQSLGYFTFKYPFAVLRTPYHMVCRLVNAISVVYYFHHILNLALRSFEWVSAWLSGIIPSGAPPPTPRRSPPRGSGERRALTPLLSPNHRLFALNHLVNLLSRHMLGLTACAIPRQLDDSIPRENYPHESAKGPFFFGVLSANGSSSKVP